MNIVINCELVKYCYASGKVVTLTHCDLLSMTVKQSTQSFTHVLIGFLSLYFLLVETV